MNITVQTVTQFTVTLDNVPGTLANITQSLAIAGVNIEGFFQTVDTSEQHGAIHFVTHDVAAARDLLASLERSFSEKTILTLQYSDKPGVIALVAQTLGESNINIEEMYLSTPGISEETVLYVGLSKGDDLKKAQEILEAL